MINEFPTILRINIFWCLRGCDVFSLLFFLLFGATCLFAQDTSQHRVIHLNDGSVLSGEVIEDNEFLVKIVIETGDTLTIGYKFIDQSGRMRKKKATGPVTYKDNAAFLALGYKQLFDFQHTYELNIIGGYSLSPKWNIGLELGFMRRPDVIINTYIEPQFLNIGGHIRYNLRVQNPRIFLGGQFGYGIVTNDVPSFGSMRSHIDGGIQGSAITGIHLASRGYARWLFFGGVNFSDSEGAISTFDQFNGEVFIEYSKTYISPLLGVMLEF